MKFIYDACSHRESLKASSQSAVCSLVSYNQQAMLDSCPIVMRSGHVLSEVNILESQAQAVEI